MWHGPTLDRGLRPTRAGVSMASARSTGASIFVGRQRELDALGGALETAIGGPGQIMLLAGEPGIGKSRTAEEIATEARRRGAEVLVGRCYEGNGAPAFWPWLQVVRAYTARQTVGERAAVMGEDAVHLKHLFPELADELGASAGPEMRDPEQARFRAFEGVGSFLRRATSDRSLVIILDDLHGADRPSLLLLEHLARVVGSCRLLLVGTLRDVSVGSTHPLTDTVAERRQAHPST